MGKSQKPLKIYVYRPLEDWDEIKALSWQGHEICYPWEPESNPQECDIILGPRCWRMDEEHRQYLDLAIQEARKIRYPQKKYTPGELNALNTCGDLNPKGGKDDPTN